MSESSSTVSDVRVFSAVVAAKWAALRKSSEVREASIVMSALRTDFVTRSEDLEEHARSTGKQADISTMARRRMTRCQHEVQRVFCILFLRGIELVIRYRLQAGA